MSKFIMKLNNSVQLYRCRRRKAHFNNKVSYVLSICLLILHSATCQPPSVNKSQDVVTDQDKFGTGRDVSKIIQKLVSIQSSSRTINGENANSKEFPWHISYSFKILGNNNESSSVHECGGTLINQTHFVTAAHCAKPADIPHAFAEFGSWSIKNKSEGFQQQRIEFKKITQHPYFDNFWMLSDISVVELVKPVTLNDWAQPLRLAPPDANPLGQICTAIGWGKTLSRNNSMGRYEMAEILQKVDLKVIDNEECKTRVGYYLAPGTICAVSPNPKVDKGTCQGDSGGSLTCYDAQGPYLAGASSWGNQNYCGKADEANVFTRITDFLDFIKFNISIPLELKKHNISKKW